MRELKSGKNAGFTVYYYNIGFDCGSYFNTVWATGNEEGIEELKRETAVEYETTIDEVKIQKVRTNNKKIIWMR